MKFLSITARNFLSFKELEYDFVESPVLIQGENLTEESQESNGSGKSAIQAAIEFALFRSTSKKVPDAELIFWGEKDAEVCLTIDCELRGETLSIQRSLKLKGSSSFEIFLIKDGEEHRVPLATVLDADNFIIDWIGISKEDLQNYFILNSERYKSFFSSSNKEKIDMINRFSNAKMIDGIDKLVKSDIEKIQKEIQVNETNKTMAIARVKLMNNQISEELNRDLTAEVEKEKGIIDLAISKLGVAVTEAKETIKTREQLIHRDTESSLEKGKQVIDLEKSLKLHEDSLNGITAKREKISKDLDTENNRIKGFEELRKSEENKLKDLRENRNELIDLMEDINKVLAGAVECPKCKHKFNYSDSTIDLAAEEAEKENISLLLESVNVNLAGCQTQIAYIGQEVSASTEIRKKVIQEEQVFEISFIRDEKYTRVFLFETEELKRWMEALRGRCIGRVFREKYKVVEYIDSGAFGEVRSF